MLYLFPFYIVVMASEIMGLVYSIKDNNILLIIFFSALIVIELAIAVSLILARYKSKKAIANMDYVLTPFNDYGVMRELQSMAENREFDTQVSNACQYGTVSFIPNNMGYQVKMGDRLLSTLTPANGDELAFNMSNFDMTYGYRGDGFYPFFKEPKNHPADAVVKKSQYDFTAIAIKKEDAWIVSLDFPQKN